MRYFLSMMISLLLLSVSPVLHASPENPNYVTIEDIEASLKDLPPMNVGFDVDETVLFSSPTFYHLSQTHCDGVLEGCNDEPGYWDKANRLDTFSLPKSAGVTLVKMHLARGDKIYFITARPYTKSETLSEILRDLFDAPALEPVVFVGYAAGTSPKVPAIKERNIQIYYGDSDGDIRAAQDPINNIRGIRMLRAQNTLENIYGAPTPGLYDEEVVKGSEF
jgi:acid phosphatase (class B)